MPLILTNTFFNEWDLITYNSKYLRSFVQASIFSEDKWNYLCVGKMVNNAINDSGSSRSRRASIKSGYLYLTK